jgi:hypothetical protein
MKCEYKDGLKVDYNSESLHIWNGSDVNVFMKSDFISSNIKNDFSRASGCDEVRKIAQAVTDTVGSKVCIHE